MNTIHQNNIEKYVYEVLRNIQAAPKEKRRIEIDLRTHIQAAIDAGDTFQGVFERMGSPAEVAVAFMSETSLQYASFWSRLWAGLLDMFIIFAMSALLALFGVGAANLVPQTLPDPSLPQLLTAGLFVLLTIGTVLGVIGLIILYFPILEGRFGMTPGKRLLHLRVLKENGLPVGYKEAFLRRLSYYFEFLPVDMLFIFFTEKHQRALDIVARTIVIREKDTK